MKCNPILDAAFREVTHEITSIAAGGVAGALVDPNNNGEIDISDVFMGMAAGGGALRIAKPELLKKDIELIVNKMSKSKSLAMYPSPVQKMIVDGNRYLEANIPEREVAFEVKKAIEYGDTPAGEKSLWNENWFIDFDGFLYKYMDISADPEKIGSTATPAKDLFDDVGSLFDDIPTTIYEDKNWPVRGTHQRGEKNIVLKNKYDVEAADHEFQHALSMQDDMEMGGTIGADVVKAAARKYYPGDPLGPVKVYHRLYGEIQARQAESKLTTHPMLDALSKKGTQIFVRDDNGDVVNMFGMNSKKKPLPMVLRQADWDYEDLPDLRKVAQNPEAIYDGDALDRLGISRMDITDFDKIVGKEFGLLNITKQEQKELRSKMRPIFDAYKREMVERNRQISLRKIEGDKVFPVFMSLEKMLSQHPEELKLYLDIINGKARISDLTKYKGRK